MSTNVIEEAIRRSQLSQSNQLEMLTFHLSDKQLYGINVFKIIEIIEAPKRFDRIPHTHPAVKGVVDFRGKPIVAIDLSEAVGLPPIDFKETLAYILICEYNRQLNAFIVKHPEALLTRNWEDVQKPEAVNAKSLVAISYTDEQEAILMLDIEGILADVLGLGRIDELPTDAELAGKGRGKRVLLVDDSKAAMMMLKSIVENLGCVTTSCDSAVQALELLRGAKSKRPEFDLIISDIEMPGMDGFTFTRTLKESPELKDIKVILHSSMSNPSNQLKAHESGADDFIAKFDPQFLSERVLAALELPNHK